MSFLQNTRSFFKRKYDAIPNTAIRVNLLNALPFWIGALITGLVAVLYAKLFLLAERASLYIFHKADWLFFICTPLSFVLAWWLVKRFAPFSRGSGIPQVSAAIELSNPKHHYKVEKLLSLRIILVKILSSLVMVFGGGVIGREGPTIQIAASIFKKINDWLPSWYPKISKRNMIVTGAAAGLASAFNTPLGGIVFAIEELTKTHFSFFKSALLTGVIIAGFTALTILGPYLYLGYPQLGHMPSYIILAVLFTALITGAASSGMCRGLLVILKKKAAIKNNFRQILYVLVCGLIIAALGIFINDAIFGSGKEIMVRTLFTADKEVAWYVPFLRMAGSMISFSTGASGGVFAPALSIGASGGAALAGWFNLSGNETNLLILCGMTGFLTGVTRSPFTSSILVIEMTNSHDIIFYLMITALTANLISNLVSKHSFYDHLKDQYIHEVHLTEVQDKPENSDIEEVKKKG
jgi:H+/Cl- antiporter ClcA